jgi:hypothetical protein
MNGEEPRQPAPEPVTIDPALTGMILRVDANLKQEIIVITADKARLCLRDAVDNMERSKAWQTPAGILITILVVFPVSTFQDFLGISKDTWKALFVFAALFFVGWLIRCLLKIRRSPTVEQIVNRLRAADSTQPPPLPTL